MAEGCLTDLPPTNPISELLMGVLGKNFFPPYDANFTADRDAFSNEKLLQFQFPGGGKAGPVGNQNDNSIAEVIAPLIGKLASAFAFFGPLFIIIDVIRAIIDIICALFNPIPLLFAIADLLINVLPPLIALFPPFSVILLAINVIKILAAIIGAIVAALIPLIADVVNNASQIITKIQELNIQAVELIEVKLCQLFQEFGNIISGFGPIKYILELLGLFMKMGAKLPCFPALAASSQASQAISACCDNSNCPPGILFPATGRAKVLSVIEQQTMPGFDDVVIIKPLTTIQILTAKHQANESGLSAPIVGQNISSVEFEKLQNYVVDPDKLSAPGGSTPSGLSSDEAAETPYTLKARVTNSDTGQSVLADLIFVFPAFSTIANSFGLTDAQLISLLATVGLGFISANYLGIIQIRDDSFVVGDNLTYEIVPNYSELMKQSLISLGCHPEVQKNSLALFNFIGGDQGFRPVSEKIGADSIPQPPIEELQDLLDTIQADPTNSVDPLPILNDYLGELAEVFDSLICAGANSFKSIFEASRSTVLANGKDKAVVAVQLRDLGDNNLILGGVLPGSNITVEFKTTFGDLGPVEFDTSSGTFRTTFSSARVGNAEITASLVVRGSECMKLSEFDQSIPAITQKVLQISAVAETGAYPRARTQNQYIHSRGGRSRR
jgi:hypothetical protein